MLTFSRAIRGHWWGIAAVVGTLLVAVGIPGSAEAHGNLDQYLDGDAGCNTSNFPASATAAGGQRQTFTPSSELISSVALCVSAGAETPLVVVILDAGGDAIGGGGSTGSNPPELVPAGPPRFVHVDFPQPVTVQAGARHTIQISGSATITWYGTAAGADLYCPGAAGSAGVGDFAFRSFTASEPGSVECTPPPPTATSVPPPPPTATPPSAQGTASTPVPEASAVAGAPVATAAAAPQPSRVTSNDSPSAQAGGEAVAGTSSSAPSGARPAAGALPAAGSSRAVGRGDVAVVLAFAATGLGLVCVGGVARRLCSAGRRR